ncbi:MAG: ATP-binding cassette domain-containing protein, partial [Tannerellaceae bacterium]|nr:ATP-binding cassette domain-containing protein [Tannerellaceae bacterium]
MNESILSGLLNLFAVFASIVKLNPEQAYKAVYSYLSSHFGVRDHKEHIELYTALRDMYDDSLIPVDKETVVKNVCSQMKVKLTSEEQVLLLIRFLEFAYTNSNEFKEHIHLFHTVAEIFHMPETEFREALVFITGGNVPSILTISSSEEDATNYVNHILRPGMEGIIRILYLQRFDKIIFTYQGHSAVYLNDNPVTPDMFYTWQYSSVIKSPLFLPVYYSDLVAVFHQDTEKEIVRLSGRDINFCFPNSPNGIHNFSFDLQSGQLVAIMGGSGVGKSTLLGIMNGNIQPQEGAVTINGFSLETPEARRLIGFVPQDDLLIEELTVYQNLWYTARLCFNGLSEIELEERVDQVLKDLDLSEIKSLQVGSPLNKTISGGQRKRLNIALELIREPAILFLDEPTSGLSSSDSEKVVTLLKEQTHRGRLVVVNIHQPSSEIYKLFDRLWLLDRGGYPIYDGNPIEAITYFKQAAKYTDPYTSVCDACGNVNPELILNIIDSKKIDDTGNQTQLRKFTPQEWHEKYLKDRPAYHSVLQYPLPESQQEKPPRWKQFLIFLERNVRTKLTNKQYLMIALLEAPVLAVIVAMLSRYSEESGYTLWANKNFISYIFMSVIVATFIGMTISAEEIIKDRPVLKRERFLRLSRGSYLTSKIFFVFCVSGVQTLLFILIGNSIIGVGKEMFLTWWNVLWITAFVANLTGLWLSQTLNSIVSIYITIPLLLIPQILLCGLVVHFDDLNTKAAEKNVVPLIGDIIPSRWAFEALVVEQYRSNAYNQAYFLVEREKYMAQYYANIHAPEVEGLIRKYQENPDKNEKRLIENELKVLGLAARIEPYESGNPYQPYLEKATEHLKTRANNFTAYLEQLQREDVQKKGKEAMQELRRKSHNEAIEDLVIGIGNNKFYKRINNRLYP